MVPHLLTAQSGPIEELEQRILDATPVIERWFRLEWMEHTPPLYAAVDLRNAGFKLAAINTSLFPQGWHNLAPEVLPLAVQAAQAAIEKICPEARKLLIVPENGQPASAYLASLARLCQIFRMAGLDVRLGSIDPALKRSQTITLPDGQTLCLEPAQRSRYRLGLKHFDPCTILLNNDLAAGAPGILEELYEQYLLPPLQAGWSVRRKSRHSHCYEEVSKRFGKLIGVDPWLIAPLFARHEPGGTHETVAQERLRAQVDAVLAKLRRKYKEYGIKEKPFVLIKPDQGGQGIGALSVRDARELDAAAHPALLGQSALLIQEGLATRERMYEAVAEPSVYLIDRYVVGGYYRLHAENESQGQGQPALHPGPSAHYVPLAFDGSTVMPAARGARGGASAPNRFYIYGVIARLALVAASYELEATDPDRSE